MPLDEETIEAAARTIFDEICAVEGMDGDEADWILYREACENAARAILKSTPSLQVDYEVPSEEEIAADIPEVTELYRRAAPAVSGEGWMKEAAKEIHNKAPLGVPYSVEDWINFAAAIIARHFPSPEGRGKP